MSRYTQRIPDSRVPAPDHKPKPRVVVIGAGIAGLTVAHELSLTGRFDIEVIEKHPIAGGKARTVWDSRGFHEHSMRLLPGSYVCLYQILEEVIASDGPLSQRLRPAVGVLRYGSHQHKLIRPYPPRFRLVRYLARQLALIRFLLRCGLKASDLAVVIYKVFRLLTIKSWQATSEISRLSFEDYITDERRSDGIEKVIFPIFETVIAAKSYAGAGVVARTLLEWFVSPFLVGRYTRREFSEFDRPTSQALVDPWVQWLADRGVRFRFGTTVTELSITSGQVDGITVMDANGVETVRGEAYVLAVQHNVAHALLPDNVVRYIPDLANFTRLGEEWAHSVQFVVDIDNPEVRQIEDGFVAVLDSPWSIAYRIYSAATMGPDVWAASGLPPSSAILTVTVSNCRRPGIVHGLPFLRCTTEQIFDEIRAQTGLRSCLREGQGSLGLDLEVIDRNEHDDEDPRYRGYAVTSVGQHGLAFRSDAQMYIRLPGNLDIEPENATGLYNFFLAGEYTRTRYMIPTMEKSCESGKRCAHALLTSFAVPKSADRVPSFELPLRFLRTEFFWLMLRSLGLLSVGLLGFVLFRLLLR